jgi:hypothetical protein
MIKVATGIGVVGVGITLREQFYLRDNKIPVIHYSFHIRQQVLSFVLFVQHSSSRLLFL